LPHPSRFSTPVQQRDMYQPPQSAPPRTIGTFSAFPPPPFQPVQAPQPIQPIQTIQPFQPTQNYQPAYTGLPTQAFPPTYISNPPETQPLAPEMERTTSGGMRVGKKVIEFGDFPEPVDWEVARQRAERGRMMQREMSGVQRAGKERDESLRAEQMRNMVGRELSGVEILEGLGIDLRR